MRFIAVLIVATLSGCASDSITEGPVRISTAFSPAEAEAIIAAVDEWNRAGDGGFRFYPVISDNRSGDYISIRPGHLPDDDSGREQLGRIMIDVDWLESDPTAIRLVSLHEIGHAIGIRYHSANGLMQSDVAKAAPCIDTHALKAACAHTDCGNAARTTCE